MTPRTHPYADDHNYAVRILPADDRAAFTVIAQTVDVRHGGELRPDAPESVSIGGIQPGRYPEFEYEDDLFWASGALGGPRGDDRRGLFPSVTIKRDDPFEILEIEETNAPTRATAETEGDR